MECQQKVLKHCSHNSCKMWIFWGINLGMLADLPGFRPVASPRIIDDIFGPLGSGEFHLDL